jgi:hypothetical protein
MTLTDGSPLALLAGEGPSSSMRRHGGGLGVALVGLLMLLPLVCSFLPSLPRGPAPSPRRPSARRSRPSPGGRLDLLVMAAEVEGEGAAAAGSGEAPKRDRKGELRKLLKDLGDIDDDDDDTSDTSVSAKQRKKDGIKA